MTSITSFINHTIGFLNTPTLKVCWGLLDIGITSSNIKKGDRFYDETISQYSVTPAYPPLANDKIKKIIAPIVRDCKLEPNKIILLTSKKISGVEWSAFPREGTSYLLIPKEEVRSISQNLKLTNEQKFMLRHALSYIKESYHRNAKYRLEIAKDMTLGKRTLGLAGRLTALYLGYNPLITTVAYSILSVVFDRIVNHKGKIFHAHNRKKVLEADSFAANDPEALQGGMDIFKKAIKEDKDLPGTDHPNLRTRLENLKKIQRNSPSKR